MKKIGIVLISTAIAAALPVSTFAGEMPSAAHNPVWATVQLALWTIGLAVLAVLMLALIKKEVRRSVKVLAAEMANIKFTADEITATITVAFAGGVKEFLYVNRRVDGKFPTPFITKEGKKFVFLYDDPREHVKSLKGSLKKYPGMIVMEEFSTFFHSTLQSLTA